MPGRNKRQPLPAKFWAMLESKHGENQSIPRLYSMINMPEYFLISGQLAGFLSILPYNSYLSSKMQQTAFWTNLKKYWRSLMIKIHTLSHWILCILSTMNKSTLSCIPQTLGIILNGDHFLIHWVMFTDISWSRSQNMVILKIQKKIADLILKHSYCCHCLTPVPPVLKEPQPDKKLGYPLMCVRWHNFTASAGLYIICTPEKIYAFSWAFQQVTQQCDTRIETAGCNVVKCLTISDMLWHQV